MDPPSRKYVALEKDSWKLNLGCGEEEGETVFASKKCTTRMWELSRSRWLNTYIFME